MKWNDILKKLTSRKLWMALAGVVTGVALCLGVDASDISTVSGAVLSVISIVTYIVTEGKIDAEGVKNAVEATQTAVDVIGGVDGETD